LRPFEKLLKEEVGKKLTRFIGHRGEGLSDLMRKGGHLAAFPTECVFSPA
jgi:hypothetical protein